MLRRFILTLLMVVGLALPASAQITITNTFTSFTVISASKINANFSTLGTNALNRTGGTLTGNLAVSGGVTIDGVDISTYLLGSGKMTATSTATDALIVGGGARFGTGVVQLIGADGRLTAISSTYFASLDGSNLTSLSAANLTGTIAAISGVNLTNLNASNLASGNVPYARMASGSGTWTATPTISGVLTVQSNVIGQAIYDNGNSGASITIDYSAHGPIQKVTRTASATYTLTPPASGAGTFVLKMIHEASANAYTVTFSPVPKYPSGSAPTYTNSSGAVDMVTFIYDGSTWYAIQTPNLS